MVEADVVRPAGRPVLHVAQVGVSIDQHVSATEQRQQSEAELQRRSFSAVAVSSATTAYLQSREAL